MQRLKMLETLSDGFEISRYDLSLRGPGDLLGTRQSGVPGFVLGNVITDEKMMEAARATRLMRFSIWRMRSTPA